ncbi:MAG: glycosyl hydrolase, partial [Limnochordia bacterium]|nr:glycosyl hydrolase [Limnochordia bacterium]
MHSRIGIRTPYLTKEWMHLVKVCVEEAEKRGMSAWLYDEDRWPSGFAGGAVPALGERYRMKSLVLAIDEIIDPQELVDIYQVYSCTMKDDVPHDIKIIAREAAPQSRQEGRTVLYIYQRTCPIGHRWFNGYCYPDFLDPVVTDAFLDSTYELYKDYLRNDFGKTILGVFTDEPACHYRWHAPKLSYQWTSGFIREFEDKYDYDLTENFLSLFFDIGEHEKIRYDFWKLLTELFLENFSKRVYQWCERHGLKLTGHFMAEDSFVSQIEWVCSVMPHYEYMHIPGIDHLIRNINHDIAAKQCSSVAHQLGRRRVLSEMYGASGQNLSFEDMKWIGDWHFVHGINLVNSHLSLYSTRGCRKRDFPPNIFIQQPYWPDMKGLSDYLSRTAYTLSCGERITDVLVLHPIETGWVTFTPDRQDTTAHYNKEFVRILEELLCNQIDYDLGDESLIERYGKVSDGDFRVGQQTYSLVVVPPMLTMRSSTLRLLRKFEESGGTVVFVGEVPRLIDGCITDFFAEQNYIGMDELVSVLHRYLNKRIEVKAVGDLGRTIWYHQRRLENGDELYFFANTSKDSAGDVTLRLGVEDPHSLYPLLLKSESGEICH